MTTREFQKIDRKLMEKANSVLHRKGQHYGSEDRLANFKRIAAWLDVEPKTVLFFFVAKHLDALRKWAFNELPDEPTDSIIDVINYMRLLKAIDEEER